MGSVHPTATAVRIRPQVTGLGTREGVNTIADGFLVVGMASDFLKSADGCPKALADRLQAIQNEHRLVARGLVDTYRATGKAIHAQGLCAAITELRNALSAEPHLADGLDEEDREILEGLLSIPARFAPYLN
ncbi:hypothetical protein A3E39_02795 [Candidatus Uhrbacteria bacterium RIFCSPHIGHO2_12_FULL_60_25]|uniref:Uncharacterized protein n=1 Tax=Candidatus Uhrbacteria bacterium RIFCSPHIGHO2_12_FULL_60_25 TaxID=1802399 RepID=A0A1F7UJF6_9BACT|nr:MAG: hypothetical protein A3D73_00060 [Candidatus Uhrbacteria bacterium RIFCSPHIGHO2_02_FULL_60_44]OGL78402.1 MAG: hypothetical protein A3E39_02795 [Candidatus Uhrbacteria bacterium RIFCSPHIGHO2_12_FULL_60_25]